MSEKEDADLPVARSNKRMDLPNWVTAIGTAVLAVCAAVPLLVAALRQDGPSQADYVSAEPAPSQESSSPAAHVSNGRTLTAYQDAAPQGSADIEEDAGNQRAPTIRDEAEPMPVSAPIANATARQLCERDSSMMGTYSGYEFTESPYCPTDSVAADKLELVERPHSE